MNLPNKLTFLRILLVPVFVILMYLGQEFRVIATIVFCIASFTDFLDGYLARKNNLVTNFGKFADPLADKILVCSAIIIFCEMGDIPAWAVIIIIAREFAITGFRIIAASMNITIAAGSLGKIKTATQLVAVILMLIGLPILYKTGLILFYISLFFTIISAVDYMVKNKEVLDLENM
ncbi:CDP-diacylglycerol--glycerol-3-phosphate 3-phosphatidyltransferase [Peptoniphilus koenoeneniae]|uniref:CDP-diacylglycerol--glycerol-3-phosphate 3-phosphatidyltransferase n=1 Tax=Peptoniphilus koenoeneniae TaxID=507751 RepID=A0ABU0AS37_9FIRM|nr:MULTISPECIES: CDP-diacylglycerol--glycerol-3-phosphate 3-phosphatidyltransferase [Peptoniphilus]ERT56790.1 CDP-diacylglycerol--glycerol-3-phosphate 3-phosphatidyltransferase [Peptoniphilus sp. BV3C26]MDQ0274077.1 CDP-diacylglycerol--glycerol-3-phosphate 3-phosphatidyltransferase [Peptoniphilus koenoeneniae]